MHPSREHQVRPAGTGFVHEALVYRSDREFVDGALPWVREGIAAGEPVLVRVAARNVEVLREALSGDAEAVDLLAAEEWYENPIRTRQKFLAWATEHVNGHRVRLLGEPPWPLQSEARVRDWARHEAVINVAFEGMPVSFICPYDARALPPAIIEHAESTHHAVRGPSGVAASESYAEAPEYCRRLDGEIAARSGAVAAELTFGIGELASLRELVRGEAERAGMPAGRVVDLVLAVNEVATNALVHGEGPAAIRVWREPGELVLEVSDAGVGIRDPLAGQFQPDPGGLGGFGLWVARMMADAVEVGPASSGSVVAIHAYVPT